jgi:hypothetical protein
MLDVLIGEVIDKLKIGKERKRKEKGGLRIFFSEGV